MIETSEKFSYEVSYTDDSAIPVIIVAAGSSTRMNGINKQMYNICGVPVLARTLMAFENCNLISNIILVVRSDDIINIQMMADKFNISKLTDVVCGGDTRQQSVKNGLSRIANGTQSVMIHDGARPLVTKKIIENVKNGLKIHSAVTCAVKIKDTVKKVDENGKIIETINRDEIMAIQTPQGVHFEEYKKALSEIKNIDSYTDDMSIMEAYGCDAFVVEGSYKNIKITTPEDILTAERFILEGEE